MELWRKPGVATFALVPVLDLEGRPRTGAACISRITQWGDGANPSLASEFYMTNNAAEMGTTGMYVQQITAAELPQSSPYALIRITASNIATQYLLVNTASNYIDLRQGVGSTLAAPVDNSVGKALAHAYMATHYLDAAISSRSSHAAADIWDVSMGSGEHNTADTTGEFLHQVHHASPYIDAAISTRSSHAAADVWDVAMASNVHNTNDTTGEFLHQVHHASPYLDATISSRSTVSAILAATVTTFTGIPSTVNEFLYFILQAMKNRLVYDKHTDKMILYEDNDVATKYTHAMTDDSDTATRGLAS